MNDLVVVWYIDGSNGAVHQHSRPLSLGAARVVMAELEAANPEVIPYLLGFGG